MFLFQEENDFREGALVLVDKPLSWTSFDAVNKIKWALYKRTKTKIKVGHAGTLDPLATGLMIVCIGKWTKKIEEFMGMEKEYMAELTLGATTPSYDGETPIDSTFPYLHIDKKLLSRILEDFIGEIEQIPPQYSAVRIEGKRAYEAARKGEKIDVPKRKVFIRRIEIITFEPPRLILKINCSKGTYIRSLVHDIGRACNSGAYLSGLRRTRIGNYKIEDAEKIDNIVVYLQNYL